ncbi:unnamed protein product [Gulo gulo]|uniref:Uncharacterized protein n=1 Tax=Gulo gulo TaxID=48420 RepID=A0A9X9M208_GULGU|nr:unnamed protein product [Gulo gulo]
MLILSTNKYTQNCSHLTVPQRHCGLAHTTDLHSHMCRLAEKCCRYPSLRAPWMCSPPWCHC